MKEMADSLDEFFAKKDKSRKSKKKNVTNEIITKLSDDSGGVKKSDKQKKDKEKANATGTMSSNTLEQADEEWNDFEDTSEKDYTGLKIQTLTIKDKEEELREQQMQENGDDNKKDAQSGPWKISTPLAASTPDDEDCVDEEYKCSNIIKAALTQASDQSGSAKTVNRYVPPHLRGQGQGQAQGSSLAPISLARKVKSNAPQIGDTNEFPSLGADIDI